MIKLHLAKHGGIKEIGWISKTESSRLPISLSKAIQEGVEKGSQKIASGGATKEGVQFTDSKIVDPKTDKGFLAVVKEILSQFVGLDEARYYVIRTTNEG